MKFRHILLALGGFLILASTIVLFFNFPVFIMLLALGGGLIAASSLMVP